MQFFSIAEYIYSFTTHDRADGGGIAIGSLLGHDKARKTHLYNQHAELLNKYSSTPEIQSDIVQTIGEPGSFRYTGTATEHVFNQASNIGFAGWAVTTLIPNKSRVADVLSKTLLGITALTAVGGITSHVMGVNHAVDMEHDKLNFVDKLAAERKTIAEQKTPAIT